MLLRVLTVFGAILALAFSLLTAFPLGLTHASVCGPATLGMLVSSVGALLGLVSLKVGGSRLGFAGAFLGLSGFHLLTPLHFMDPYRLSAARALFWWGPGLTMLGVMMMFGGLAAQSRVVPRLALLGYPFLLEVWLLPPP